MKLVFGQVEIKIWLLLWDSGFKQEELRSEFIQVVNRVLSQIYWEIRDPRI